MHIKRTIIQLKEYRSNKNNKGHDAELITHHPISPHLPCNSPILCLLLFIQTVVCVLHVCIHILHMGLGFRLLPVICNLLLNFYVYYEHLISLYIHIALFWISWYNFINEVGFFLVGQFALDKLGYTYSVHLFSPNSMLWKSLQVYLIAPLSFL